MKIFFFFLFKLSISFQHQLQPIQGTINNHNIFLKNITQSFRKQQLFFIAVKSVQDIIFLYLTKKMTSIFNNHDPRILLSHDKIKELSKKIIILAISFITYNLISLVIEDENSKLERNIQQRTYNTVLNHLLHQHYDGYSSDNSAQLSGKIQDISHRVSFIITRQIMIGSNIFSLIYLTNELSQLSWWIFAVFGGVTGFNYWVNSYFRNKYQSILPNLFNKENNLTNSNKSILDSFLLVHLNQNQTSIINWLIKNQKQYNIINNKSEKLFLNISAFMEVSMSIFHIGGILIILRNKKNIGDVMNFDNFSQKFANRFNGMAGRFFAILQMKDKYAKAFKDLNLKPWNKIPFRNLEFTGSVKIINGVKEYGNKPVFQGNFSSNSFNKKYVNIMGPSGSGKTTFLKVIGNITHLNQGEILVETKNPQGKIIWYSMDKIHPQDISNNILFITQENYFFHQSLKENLEMGRKVVSYDDILEDLKLTDLIKQKGDINFVIENNGTNLSGGQRQRISIARALVQNRIKGYKIILLDEYNSALDEESKKLIDDIIRKSFKDRLVLSITHDGKSVKSYDKIINFKDGIIESQD